VVIATTRGDLRPASKEADMRSTGPRTGNPLASDADREWSEAALLDRAEHAESEAKGVREEPERTPIDEPETLAPLEAARRRPAPWWAVAVVGTFTVLPWLVLGAVAYLVYVLLA